jgi:hypothetical protein
MSAARLKAFAPGALIPSAGAYAGHTLRETTGTAPAVIRLWDNASAASGTLIATIALPTSTSSTVSIHGDGVWFASGMYAEIVTGACEGSVFVG